MYLRNVSLTDHAGQAFQMKRYIPIAIQAAIFSLAVDGSLCFVSLETQIHCTVFP